MSYIGLSRNAPQSPSTLPYRTSDRVVKMSRFATLESIKKKAEEEEQEQGNAYYAGGARGGGQGGR